MPPLFLAAVLPLLTRAQPPEVLPPPRVAVEAPRVIVLPPAAYRPDPRAHWQGRAVDGQGVFRPAVATDPFPHYRLTGEPYYGLPVRGSR
jgi:hypothetical protein